MACKMAMLPPSQTDELSFRYYGFLLLINTHMLPPTMVQTSMFCVSCNTVFCNGSKFEKIYEESPNEGLYNLVRNDELC